MFCPLFGIVLADYFLIRRERLEMESLYRKEGPYWFYRGVNPVAILSWILGFILYLGFSPMLMEKVIGIKASFSWPIGSSLPSMVGAGLLYWVCRMKEGIKSLG
jgi:cytosine/uracil/thiamine/allantoin permease